MRLSIAASKNSSVQVDSPEPAALIPRRGVPHAGCRSPKNAGAATSTDNDLVFGCVDCAEREFDDE